MGWIFRDLEDASLMALPFGSGLSDSAGSFSKFAAVSESFLDDCEPEIVNSFRAFIRELEALGLEGRRIGPEWWAESKEIFLPIQAWEAARVHADHFEHFEPSIRERLEMGARIAPAEISALRQRHSDFRSRMDDLFAANELLVLPCAPVAKLTAGEDHSQTRSRLLRYTTPFSLAGVPVVSVPCKPGGMQLAAGRGCDERLLQLASQIGAQRNVALKAHA
jgi:aspartyl-tRNA(Asn)/glutamyl-tRNA(Gln) amidotransferase subunit A